MAWRIRKADGPPGDKAVTDLLERSRDLYLAVIENHAGTPRAARAEWELNRDFNYPLSAPGLGAGSGWGLAWHRGVELVPEYGVPSPPAPPASGPAGPAPPTMPVPRL